MAGVNADMAPHQILWHLDLHVIIAHMLAWYRDEFYIAPLCNREET